MEIDLSQLRVPSNYVVIKTGREFETYQMNGRETGISVSTDLTSRAQNYNVSGIVFKTPEEILFNGDAIKSIRQANGHGDMVYDATLKQHVLRKMDDSVQREIDYLRSNSMMYKVPMEVRAGDHVLFNYQQYFDAYKNKRWCTWNGDEYIWVRYDELFCKFNPESPTDVSMLNGYILIDPIKIPTEKVDGINVYRYKSGIEKPILNHGFLRTRTHQIGRVITSGCLCEAYREFLDIAPDSEKLTAGQYICFDPRYAVNLEYDLHRTLFPNKTYRLHRKNVYQVWEKETDFDLESIIDNFV